MTESKGEMSFGDEPRTKECGQLREARQGKEMGSVMEPWGGNAVLPKS